MRAAEKYVDADHSEDLDKREAARHRALQREAVVLQALGLERGIDLLAENPELHAAVAEGGEAWVDALREVQQLKLKYDRALQLGFDPGTINDMEQLAVECYPDADDPLEELAQEKLDDRYGALLDDVEAWCYLNDVVVPPDRAWLDALPDEQLFELVQWARQERDAPDCLLAFAAAQREEGCEKRSDLLKKWSERSAKEMRQAISQLWRKLVVEQEIATVLIEVLACEAVLERCVLELGEHKDILIIRRSIDRIRAAIDATFKE